MSDTMHSNSEVGELVPVLSEILKIEADTLGLLGDAQTKARKIMDEVQQRTQEVAAAGQIAAKEQAVAEVKEIQQNSYDEVEALKKEGSIAASELREQIERNLGNAIDLVIDRVIEGDSCLTGTEACEC